MDIMKALRKAKSDLATAEAQQKEEEELSKRQTRQTTAPELQQSSPPQNGTDPAVLERITGIENKTPKLEISIASIKRENDEIKNKLIQVDTKLIEMLSLYEVVANQVNPFVGISKVTSANIEKLERVEEQVGTIENKIISIENDLKVISSGEINIADIVKEVLEEDYE